jgi:uncharacterized oxidoreductase
MAEAFLTAGSKVAICGRREAKLREARLIRPEFKVRVCDVSKEDERERLVDWGRINLPGLNVLINNAGVQRDIDFTDAATDFLKGENEIRTNLESTIALSGLFVPLLRSNEGAAIINVSSGLGFVPSARMPVYSASKAGIHAFSMALRCQLAKVGMKVFEIVPPAVDTELNLEGRAARRGFKPNISPKEFVVAVMKGLECDCFEIGYGMTSEFIHASRADLDRSFQRMNCGK